jgi:hypothetical protein
MRVSSCRIRQRRKEYDSLYRSKKERTEDPSASANFFTSFANMFGGKGPEPASENAERPDADHMFADVFDEVSGFLSFSIIVVRHNNTRFSSCDQRSRTGLRGGRTSEPLVVLA